MQHRCKPSNGEAHDGEVLAVLTRHLTCKPLNLLCCKLLVSCGRSLRQGKRRRAEDRYGGALEAEQVSDFLANLSGAYQVWRSGLTESAVT